MIFERGNLCDCYWIFDLVKPFVMEKVIVMGWSFWVHERLHNGRQDGINNASVIAILDIDNCMLFG